MGRRLEENKQQLISNVEQIILSEDASFLMSAPKRTTDEASSHKKKKDKEEGNQKNDCGQKKTQVVLLEFDPQHYKLKFD